MQIVRDYMIVSCFALALAFGESLFATPLPVSEPQRLALTPVIDGQLAPFEWDSFAGSAGNETYFQWEPGKVHAAAKLRSTQDLLISLDLNGDGWLIGSDNYECRVSIQGATAVTRVRKLDATESGGPRWVDVPVLEKMAIASALPDANGWTAELSLVDPRMGILPTKEAKKVGVRVDAVERTDSVEPYLPRLMTNAAFVFDRGSSVPGGLKWATQYVTRSVSQGGSIKIRLTFNGQKSLDLKRVEMDSIGAKTEDTADISVPFPEFDGKGRAFVDYLTPIPASVEPGYRVLRAVVSDKAGNAAFLRSSYRVAPTVEFELGYNKKEISPDKPEQFRMSYYIHSNSMKKLEGSTRVEVPEGWTLVTGDSEKRFIVYNSHGAVRRVFDLTAPVGTSGTFPIKMIAEIGDRKFESIEWLTIEPRKKK